ncbi:MAG: hypothetical protein HY827_04425 [Actinobacteria bacterium]|nr:hypothetical protein [Actinomycetota bacterium]
MNRDQLIHIVRASARITNETRFIVVGSQSILATRAELPDPLVFSMEADIYPRESPEKAIEIDGAIGEGSINERLVEIETMLARVDDLPVSPRERERVRMMLDGIAARVAKR